jgi:hypothetical protein
MRVFRYADILRCYTSSMVVSKRRTCDYSAQQAMVIAINLTKDVVELSLAVALAVSR